jgi:hypothetical protein
VKKELELLEVNVVVVPWEGSLGRKHITNVDDNGHNNES